MYDRLGSSLQNNLSDSLLVFFKRKSVVTNCGMVFPVEIIERILLKCDGQTLLNCRDVNYVFKMSVDYLVQVGFINKRLHR